MTAYYLSNAGNDAAAGTSEATAWATIGRLNTALAANVIIGGDSILFRRGDTFYGSPTHSGHLAYPNSSWTVYGAYGTGARPRITCYKVALLAGWQDQGSNVWRINLAANSGVYTGAVDLTSTNVGHIRVDGVIHGVKRNSQAALSATWDFYSGDYAQTDTSGYLYVKSTGNPSLGRTVEIATAGPIFSVQRHRTRFQDLEIVGGDSGIEGNSYWSPHDVEVTRCEIHDLGGCYLYGLGTITRGGNGVQAWIGQTDWDIHGNDIYNCYDVGVTYQGGQGVQVIGNTASIRIHAHHNRIWNNCQTFETWSQGTTGAGFVDCSFTDNLCFNSGLGWGQAVRPDPAGRGCHVLFYEHELPADITIERNVFFGAFTGYMFALHGVPAGVILRNNAVYIPDDLRIQTSTLVEGQRSETIGQAAAYVAATGLEQGTEWFTTEAAAQAHLAALSRGGRLVPTPAGLRVIPDTAPTWPAPPAEV